jgi:hypothetical protein
LAIRNPHLRSYWLRKLAARIPPQAGHLISSEQQGRATRQHHRYDSDEHLASKPAPANAEAKAPPPAVQMSLPPVLPGTSNDFQADSASSILVTR